MSIRCPRCTRKIAGSSQPGDPAPAFCMFCGQKLRDDLTPARPVMPDDDADSPSLHTETLAFIPPLRNLGDVTSDSTPGSHETSTDITLTAVAGYTFVKFLGAGGMGTVYEAESSSSGKRVAVKLLSPKLAANPSSVERFRQEGRVASQITHPRCVFVLQADTEQGRPFIIMELMPGRTLKDLVDQRGPLHYGEAIDRILDAIDGLIEAHRQGVIHRDVKPSNCFLTEDDRVKVGDFGLSKSLLPADDDDTGDPNAKQLTQSGAFLGTIMYASPEQIRGEPVSYDSDVYSVCATLYYLLTGKAPFQHESLTASLAKAVSEAAPPIRDRFPDVPRELEKVILRGLDRDRTRRWQTLEDLRDELVELQVEKQQPASVRAILLAYILDIVLLQFISIPMEILRRTLSSGVDSFDALESSWPSLIVSFLYFAFFEGLLGATPGKRLLRLTVVGLGQVGPPGLWKASIRSALFLALWTLVYLVPEWAVEVGGKAIGIPLGLSFSLLLVSVLGLQFRRTLYGRRGVHDFASETRTIQRPRAQHRPRLLGKGPNPLDRLMPTSEALPSSLGGYAVSGKLCNLPDGGEVWLGEDKALGRTVLLRLLPPSSPEPADSGVDAGRPTRLRVLGGGSFGGTVDGQLVRRAWTAYVAPAGAPLVDVVSPEQPLGWIDVRPILEQLTDELHAMEDAGEAFAPTAVEQLWVEPNGRMQRLDFPLPTGRRGITFPKQYSDDAPSVLRAAATLMLEGNSRNKLGTVRAPIPPHAKNLLRRLFVQDRAFANLTEVKDALVENQHFAPQLTGAARAGHLGVLSMMLSLPLLLFFVCAATVSFLVVISGVNFRRDYTDLRTALDDPEMRIKIALAAKTAERYDEAKSREIDKRLSPEFLSDTLAKLDRHNERHREAVKGAERTLNRPERMLLTNLRTQSRAEFAERSGADVVYGIDFARAVPTLKFEDAIYGQEQTRNIRISLGAMASGFCIGMVFVWAVIALIFRGGVSNRIAGIVIIRDNGTPATRIHCFLRELLVWLPMLSLTLASIGVQMYQPEWVVIRTALWIGAILLLPVYVVVALLRPARPPQDRLMGTHLMPE